MYDSGIRSRTVLFSHALDGREPPFEHGST